MSNERNSLPECALAQESGERRHERTELLDSREYQASNEMQTLLELGLDIVDALANNDLLLELSLDKRLVLFGQGGGGGGLLVRKRFAHFGFPLCVLVALTFLLRRFFLLV